MSTCTAVGIVPEEMQLPYSHGSITQMHVLGSSALEEEGAKDNKDVPPGLLMDVMDIRERLEHCSSKKDAESILFDSSQAAEQCLRDMNETLQTGGSKDELAELAVRLRYMYRIQEEAQGVVHNLEDSNADT